MVHPHVYSKLHVIATVTKIIVLTLILFTSSWYRIGILLGAFVIACIDAIILLIAEVLHVCGSIRDSTPPIVTVVMLGIAAILTIVEIILLAIAAFHEKYLPLHDISTAGFSYNLVSLIAIIVLAVITAIAPPTLVVSK